MDNVIVLSGLIGIEKGRAKVMAFYEDHGGGALITLGMKNGFVAIRKTTETDYALFEVHNGKVNKIVNNNSTIVAGAAIYNFCVVYDYTSGGGIQILWWGVSGIVEGLAIGV